MALRTDAIAALSTHQVAALTSCQISELSADQFNAMSTTQFQSLRFNNGTPLVLDLNNNGILSQSIASDVHFDLFATGQQIATGWTDPGDGFLVLDRNHDGTINDGSELFGDATWLSDGNKASNGYEALAELDSNLDGQISNSDFNFADLRVWTDANSNGLTDSGELLSLQDMGIASLDLQATSTSFKDNGNSVGLVSSYQDREGNSHTMADVWFVTDKPNATAAASPILTVETTALQAGVFGLVDAMAAFGQSEASRNFDINAHAPNVTASLQSGSASGQSLSGAATQLAQALSQFDANGRPVTLVAAEQTPLSLKHTGSKQRDPTDGFLAMDNG